LQKASSTPATSPARESDVQLGGRRSPGDDPAQVMDIINNSLAVNPFKVLKLRLLEAHVLSDQEKIDALFQLGPLGDRKPSQLLASMLLVWPSGMEIQSVPSTSSFSGCLRCCIRCSSSRSPVPLRSVAASEAAYAARRTGLRRHPLPGCVGGQVVGIPQVSATRGDGSAGASQ